MSYAQEEIHVSYEACAGGFITGEQLMNAGLVPNGQRDGGTWVDTGGLDFSDFGRSPTISGFVSGNTYVIRWRRTPSKVYVFTVEVLGSAPEYQLLNASSTTNDVVNAGGTHTFSVDPIDGDPVVFYSREMPDGDLVLRQSGTSSSFNFSVPATGVHEISAMVTAPNGCVAMTNSIEISQNDLQIRVEGGKSVCDGTFDFNLYVRPYDASRNHGWLKDGTVVETNSETVFVDGPGEYQAFIWQGNTGDRPFESAPVVVGDYQLPTITLTPPDVVALCDANLDITGTMNGLHPEGEDVSYRWYNYGSTYATGELTGGSNTITVNDIGSYDFRIFETANPLCYRQEGPVTVLSPMATIDLISGAPCGPYDPSFIIEIIGQVGDTWEVTLSNGSDTRTLNLHDSNSDGAASGIISWGSEITENTTFTITSIVSGTTCEITDIPDAFVAEVNDYPTVFEVSGGGCSSEDISIQLSGSESDVTYDLLRGGVFVQQRSGTGSSITFNVTNAIAGTYTIRASRGDCETPMDGSVIIAARPLSDLGVSLAGTGCAASTHAITVANSQADVYYSLYRDGTEVRTPRLGNGGNLLFDGITTTGSYEVKATRGNCEVFLDNTVFIAPRPALQTIAEPRIGCEGIELFVTLGNSETGVEYSILDAGGVVIETVTGTTGVGFTFDTGLTTVGVYSIRASNTHGCFRDLGTVEVLSLPNTTYTLYTPASPACSGTTGHNISLNNGSETDVVYRLYRNSITGSPLATRTGDGNPIDFGSQSVAGTYMVTADNGGCEVKLPSELILYQQPNVYNVTPGTYCQEDDVTITLNNSQSSVTYFLFRDGVDYGSDQSGSTGNSIFFGPEKYPPGTYTIRGSAGGCFADMNGSVTVNANPVINIPGLPGSYCADAGSQTVSGSPANANGSWSVVGFSPLPNFFTDNGNGTLTFNVTNAVNNYGERSFSFVYTYTDPNGCISTVQRSSLFQEDLADVVRFSGLPGITCQDGSVINLQAYFNYTVPENIVDNAGSGFSGSGITNTGPGTADFDPVAAGNGLHTIVFDYIDPVTGCRASYSQTVQVGTTLSIEGLSSIYCVEDGVQEWYGIEEGGRLIVYAVDEFGVRTEIANRDNTTALDPLIFNPSVSGAGTYVAVYQYTDAADCVNEIEEVVVVEAELNTNFSLNPDATQFCSTINSVQLIPEQSGGYFSGGSWVSTQTFSPAIAGDGDHEITYTISTSACNSSSSLTVRVIDPYPISIDNLSDRYCENAAGPILLEVNNPGVAGATYTFTSTLNGAGRSPLYVATEGDSDGTSISAENVYFSPAYVGEGTYTITYTFDNTANDGCIAVVNRTVHVDRAPAVNFGGTADPIQYCQDAGMITLTGSFVSGGFTGSGNFAGPGVDNGILDDGLATFDPSGLTGGSHLITYTYTHINGCTTERTKTFEVLESPLVYNVTPLSSEPHAGRFCAGDAGVTIGLEDSESGITYHLILNYNLASPVETIIATGGVLEFDPVNVVGDYIVQAVSASGCSNPMNGVVEVRRNNVSASINKQNVSCTSGNDGAASVTASGGSVPYVYYLYESDGTTLIASNASGNFTNLDAGTYFVEVEDAIGCELVAPVSITINEPSLPLSVNASAQAVGCMPCTDGLDCEGSATISITGGTPFTDLTTYPNGFDIEWRDSGNNIIGTGLSIIQKPAGDYTYIVEDANGCIVSGTIEIETINPIVVNEDLSEHVDVLCHGSSTGEFLVTASGGATDAVYQFSLDGVNWQSANVGSDARRFINRPAGTYTVSVRDFNTRCVYESDPIVISEPDALTLDLVPGSRVHVDCFGNATGEFRVVAGGGSGDYEFSINNGATWVDIPLFSDLSANTYNVRVRDVEAPSCMRSLSVQITQPVPLVISDLSATHVLCHGDNNGSLSVTASGGTAPYGYVWEINDGGTWVEIGTSSVMNNRIAGTYRVTITDVNGCVIQSNEITINQPASPLDISVSVTPTACSDVDSGTATVSISGGTPNYSVFWSQGGTVIGNDENISSLAAGSYSVRVEDANGCLVEESFTIAPLTPLVIENVTVDNHVSCNGGNNGELTVTVSGGSETYRFSLDGDNWFSVASQLTDNLDGTFNYQFENLTADNYTVYVKDAANPDCQVQSPDVPVNEPAALTLLVQQKDNVTCYNGNNGIIRVEAQGGSSPYEYSIDAGTTWQPSNEFTGLSAGNHNIRVRDANLCVYQMAPVNISQPAQLQVFVEDRENASCNGIADGFIEARATGGSGNYVYSLDGTDWQPSPLFEGLSAATYQLRVHDAADDACVSALLEVIITEPTQLVVSEVIVNHQNVSCHGGNDGSFRVMGTGGSGNYEFSIDNNVWVTNNTAYYSFSNLEAGGYTVYIREQGNTDCFAVIADAIEITEPAQSIQITNAILANVACYGESTGSITITVVGGNDTQPYNYVWERQLSGGGWTLLGAANDGTTASPQNLRAGTYRVLVTDSEGCSVTAPYEITEPTSPLNVTMTSVQHVTTNGGNNGALSISITGGTGGYTIFWSGVDADGDPIAGLPTNQTDLSGLTAGVYTATVFDDNDCTSTIVVEILEPGHPLQLILEDSSNPLCFGENTGTIELRATGGTFPYTVTLTRSSGDNVPAFSVSGNYYTYTGLSAGFYNAVVEDDNGETFSIPNIEITQPAQLVLNIESTVDATCFGSSDGRLSFSATGGSPGYSYTLWPDNGASRTRNVADNAAQLYDDLLADRYRLMVQDANGCASPVEEIFISQPDEISITGTPNNISCFGADDGSITINVTGGRGNVAYNYNWYELSDPSVTISTERNLENAAAGNYVLEITEQAGTGCSAVSDVFTITEPSEMVVSVNAFDVNTCTGDNSGRLVVSVTGGTAPYLIDYGTGTANGSGPLFNIENLIAGDYTVRVIDNDGAGCEIVVPDNVIGEPAAPISLVSLDFGIDCDAAQSTSGFVTFEVTGGLPGGDYEAVLRNLTNPAQPPIGLTILDGDTQPVTISNLRAARYELTITNRNVATTAACPAIVETFELTHLVVSGNVTNATCAGANNGAIDVNIEGGSGTYTYAWTKVGEPTFSSTEQDLSGLSAGSYIVEVTDVIRACTVTETFVVQDGKTLVIEASVSPVSCNGGNNGAILVNNVPGAAPPVQFYWNGEAGTDTRTGLTAGVYELRVVDGEGCEVIRSFTVPEPPAVTYVLATILDDCEPYSRSIEIESLTGGVSPYNITWSGPGAFTVDAGNQSISGITKAGTYKALVRDSRGCETERTIMVPGRMELSANVTHISCNGGNNGMIDLVVSGGSGNYQYAWTKVGNGFTANTQDIDGLEAGTYTVVVTDINQTCVVSGDSYTEELEVTLNEPAPIAINFTKQHLDCAGDANGIIDITEITGGTGSYTLTWAPASAPGIVQGQRIQRDLEGGEYTVTIRDENNCVLVHSFEIIEPAPLNFTLEINDTDCDGNNRIAIVDPVGGSGSYTYVWAGPEIPAGFNGLEQTDLPGGEYTITMIDNGVGNCAIEKSLILTRPLQVEAAVTNASCPGVHNGAISLNISHGVAPYTFNWETISGTAVNASDMNQSGLRAGLYRVTVTDARGCDFLIDNIEVEFINQLDIGLSVVNVTCHGDSNGRIEATVFGGTGEYQFSLDGAGWTAVPALTHIFDDLTSGSYTVFVRDVNLSGCYTTKTVDVLQPSAPINAVATITDVLCKGEFTGEIDIEVTGGTAPYTYQWTTTTGGGLVNTAQDQEGLSAGSYHLRVEDSEGCVANFGPFEVTEPELALNIEIVDVVNVAINGNATGAIEVITTGGSFGYTYVWEIYDEDSDVWNEVVGETTHRIENRVAGLYRVTVTDGNGCEATLQQRITEPDTPLTIDTQVDDIGPCHGAANGSIEIVVSGGNPKMDGGQPGYDIVVIGPGTNTTHYGTTLTLNNLQAGIYQITATDALGIVEETDVTIDEPDEFIVNVEVIDDVTCYAGSDGSIRVEVSGGSPNTAPGRYRIRLSGNGISRTEIVEEQFLFENLIAGPYQVTVWDDFSGDGNFNTNYDCTKTFNNIVVTQPEAHAVLTVMPGSNSICEGNIPQLQVIVSNWDVVTTPLELTLNDGTVVTVNQTPMVFDAGETPPVGINEYSIASLINPATTCSAGTFTGNPVVVVNPLPTAYISGDKRICFGSSDSLKVELTGTPPWNITYSNGIESFEINGITESTYTIENVAPAVTSTYTILEVTDYHCTNSGDGSAIITVDQPTTVEFVPVDYGEICIEESIELQVLFNPANTGSWRLRYWEIDPTGTLDPIRRDLTVTRDQLVDDTLKIGVVPRSTARFEIGYVFDTHDFLYIPGCPGIVLGEPANVIVRQRPVVPDSIVGEAVVCQGSEYVFSVPAVLHADGYEWTVPTNAEILSGENTREILVHFTDSAQSGYITVRAVNSCGGETQRHYVTVDPLPLQTAAIIGLVDICQGSSEVVFSTNEVIHATSYNWDIPVGFTIVGSQTGSTIRITPDPDLAVFTGQISVTPANDCGESVHTATHTFHVRPLPTVNAGADQHICLATHTLNADELQPGESGLWTVVPGSMPVTINDPTEHNSEISNVLPENNTILRWTVTSEFGCSASDDVTIRNNQLSVYAYTDKLIVCDGSANLYGREVPDYPNTSGVWSVVEPVGSTAAFANAASYETTVSNLAPDRNVLRWTITQNGCDSYADVVIMNHRPDDAIINGAKTINRCDQDVITLEAEEVTNGDGRWSIIKGFTTITPNPESSTITVSNFSEGEIVLRWTVTNKGCSDYDEVTIRNNKVLVNAGPPQEVCENEVFLAGTEVPAGADESGWEFIEGIGTFNNGNIHNPHITDLGLGENILEWRILKNGCISTDSVIITNNSPATATVGSTQTKCDFKTELIGNDPDGQGTGRWSIVKGSGIIGNYENPVTGVTNLGYGENIFRWTITNGACSTFADLVVNNLHVDVDAGKDFPTCTRAVTMNGSPVPSGMTGSWQTAFGSGGATIPLDERGKHNATISVDLGRTELIWTITNGTCVSRDTVIVTNNMPDPVNAGPYREINDVTHKLEALEPDQGTGRWQLISGGGSILEPTLFNATVTNLRRGENVFRWTVTHGDCSVSDEVTILNGQVTEANAGLNREVCTNSTTLNANDPDVAIGTWSVVSGTANFDEPNNPRTRVTNLSPGPNELRWTIQYSNTSSYSEVIITNNQPGEPIARFDFNGLIMDNAICGDSVTLIGNNSGLNIGIDMGTPKWVQVQGGGEIDDDEDYSTYVTGLTRGINEFVYSLTKGNCPPRETRITIINGTPSTPNAGGPYAPTCTGSVQLRPQPILPNHGVATWRAITPGEITFNDNRVHNLSQGENVLVYEIATDYCTLTDTATLINNQVLPAYAGPPTYRQCSDEYEMKAWPAGSAGSGQATGTWSRISGGGVIDEPNNPNTMIEGLALGANRFRWTVSYESCSDYDEVIIYNDHIEAEILLDDYTHCADTLGVSARAPMAGSGTWGIAQGRGNFDNNHSANTVVRNLQRGENVITWTVNHRNCSHTDELTITNNMATQAFAGEDDAFCVENATLTGNVKRDVETSVWTLIDGSGLINSPDNSAVTTVSGLGFGENIFRYTIRHQDCISYDEVTIENNHIAANAGPDRTYCSNEAVLAGSNPGLGVGTWSVPGGLGAAVFDNPNSPTTRVTNLGKGSNTLRWTVRYKGCTHSDDVIITNNLPITPNAGNTQILCRDNTTLEASPLGAGEQGEWVVLTGSADFANENLHNTQVTNLGKGDNILRWTIWRVEGCALSEEVLIRNNDPYEPNAGSDYEEVCERTFTLKADAPEFGTGSWSFVQGGGNLSDPYNPRATITNLDHGTNILRWTVEQGNCARSATITIENNTPNRANAGPDIEDCKDSHVLDANVPLHGATGRWERMSGYGEFDNENDPKTTVRNLEFGMNQFRWIIEKGNCFSSDVITVFNMVPDRADAGSDRIGICENYLTLNANNPESGTGQWTVVKGKGTFDNPDQYNSVVRNVGFGENIYRWSISYGSCSTEDEMTVVSHKTNAYAGEDQVVYEPRALLNANNAGDLNARWIIVGTSTAEFEDETFFNTNVYNLSDGINTFRWEVEVEGCIASDQVSIDYRVVPDAGFITDVDSGCFPLRVLFTNYSVGGSDYIWDFDDGHSSEERNPVHVFESPGVYNVRLIAPGPDGRDGEYFKEIVVHDHPVADFTVNPQVVYLPGEKARFYDLSIDAISWLWNFGDGTTSTDRNPSYEYRDEGVYDVSLTVTNDRGCENTFTQSGIITAYQQGFVRFPNAFRPRPDGASGGIDPSAEYVVVFKPAYKDVDEFKLEIFNRWGQKIYETNDIDQGWDGMHDGRLAPQAVYVYQVSGRYISGREFRKTGSVLLVR